MTNFLVGVKLDGNSAGLAKSAAEAKKALDGLNAAAGAGAKTTAKTHAQAVATMRSDYQRMTQAREALGIRSERRIQQEILQTQLAYRRLADSGTMSWREQSRAAAAMHKQVRDLNSEMGRLTTRQRVAAGFRGAGLAVAGGAAATAVLAPKVQKAMAYDLRLAHMSNTAFNDRDKAGRAAGKRELDAMITDAVRYGGGTRDDAASTLNTLLASGEFNPKDAATIFREAVMAGTANDTDGASFANLAVKARKSLSIAPERMGAVFGMGTFAGQQGQFEIRDMAKHLPRQMGSARQLGLYGEAGFAKLTAVNQAAMNTAGSADEAGINVANLVAKMASTDTQKQFKKQLGIDLPKAIAEGRIKGIDAFDIVGGILDTQLSKNKNYQAVQKQLSATAPGSDERRASLEAVGNIAQGTVIGQVFQDQQALMALVGFMQDRKRVAQITAGALTNTDAATRNMAQIRDTPSFSAQQWSNEQAISNQSVMDGLTPAFKALTDKTVGLMQEYPGYTTAIVGTTTALTSLAAAAGAAALANGLLAGGGAGRLGGVVGKVGGLLGGAAGAAGSVALPALAVGAAGAVGYGAGTLISKGIEGTAVGDSIGEVVARTLALFGNEEAAQAVAVNDAIKNSRVGGEIAIRIQGDPTVAVQHEATPFNGTKMRVRSDVGRTSPEGSW